MIDHAALPRLVGLRPAQAKFMRSAVSFSVLPTLLALAILTLLSSLFATDTRAEEADPWIIAVAGPMSGDKANLGQSMLDAAQIRADKINAAGGVAGRTIEIVPYDDQNDPEAAAKAAEAIAADGTALLVLGHRTSGASLAAAPIYNEHEIPAMMRGSNPR